MAQLLKNCERASYVPQYFDIGVNLSDKMFDGFYNDKKHHKPDLPQVLARAAQFNVNKMLVTGSSLSSSKEMVGLCDKLSQASPGVFYSTVGVHPCSSEELNKENIDTLLKQLYEIALDGKKRGIVKAFGEIGLDYDRLHYASKETQCKVFARQLDLACKLQLPLFLHMRAACDDFVKIIKPYLDGFTKNGKYMKLAKSGVVHSFTGSESDLETLLSLGFHISVNGCSLRSEEGLEVAKKIPLSRLHIETDAPWCEIKQTHPAYKLLSKYPNFFYPGESVESPKKQVHAHLPYRVLQKKKISEEELEKECALLYYGPPMVKNRNEPVCVGLVAEIVCKLRNEDPQTFVETVYQNSRSLFEV